MPDPSVTSTTRAYENADSLRSAFSRAIQFNVDLRARLAMTDEHIKAFAEEEASYGRLSVDADGVTPGMKRHIIQAAYDLTSEWSRTKGAFMTALQPFVHDIDASDKLTDEIEDLKKQRDQASEQIRRSAKADLDYVHLEEDLKLKASVYHERHNNVGRRKITMGRYHPLYWIAMLCIGVAEWLINYDTFYIFMGVPAIAAGTTIILGVLLAFSADGYGTLLKQWSAKFGRDVARDSKRSAYMYLTLSTFGLVVVLWAAGGFRYAIAIHLVSGQPQINILGAQATIVVNPLRDVLLSLLANVAAWAVGVFLAYACHDENPELMGALYDFQKAKRKFEKKDRPTAELIKTREAQLERAIAEKQKSAVARSGDVAEQRHMLHQVLKHEETIMNGIVSVARRNAELYREKLMQLVLGTQGATQIFRGSVRLTPYEFDEIKLNISADRLAASDYGS